MKFFVFFALSIFGLQNILASLESPPVSDKEYFLYLSKLVLIAINSAHAANYDFRFYEATRVFSHVKSLLRPMEVFQPLHLLQQVLLTAEEQFEKSFATIVTESYVRKLEISSQGIIKNTPKLEESLKSYNPRTMFYPIPLLRLLNKRLENETILSMQEILDSSPEHLWTPVDWCVFYWQAFSRHLTITSPALFQIFENLGHDPDFLSLKFQTKLLETFSKYALGHFDHFSSYGNVMATYFLFSYMRLLLRIACDLSSDKPEAFALSDYAEDLWKIFLNCNIKIKCKLMASSEVDSWLHEGKFIPKVKKPTSNHLKINAITINQILNDEENKIEMISFAIREKPLPNSKLPVPCLDFYVSSKNENKKFYKKIMKIMIDRLTQSELYTEESILVLKKGILR
jgi:hypothetical protein